MRVLVPRSSSFVEIPISSKNKDMTVLAATRLIATRMKIPDSLPVELHVVTENENLFKKGPPVCDPVNVLRGLRCFRRRATPVINFFLGR
jgi:hypothetical protein